MTNDHGYGCGCASCDRSERDDERRDEHIQEHAPAIAKTLLGAEDFAADALADEIPGARDSILRDAGRFFERFHNAHDDPSTLASIAVDFYRDLLPYVEAAAKEKAEEQAGAEHDKATGADL